MGSVWDHVENCTKCSVECIPEVDGMCRGCSPIAVKRDQEWAAEKAKELRMVLQFIEENNIRWVSVR